MQIDDPLVDPHLEAIPRLGTFTTGSFPRGDPQGLRRHTNRTVDNKVLVLSLTQEVGAHSFQSTNISTGQRNPVKKRLMDIMKLFWQLYIYVLFSSVAGRIFFLL